MIILAIETSCDDTGVALLDVRRGQVKILADFVSSQTAIHAPYGGVVPNLAVRAHYKNLPILLEKTLTGANAKKIRTGSLYSPNLVFSPCSKIDLIAVTIGPGLEPCLWAGVNTARVLAKAMNKPLVGVNHLEGHIAANFISGISLNLKDSPRRVDFKFQISNKNSKLKNSKIDSKFKIQNSLFPSICLIVSGGHTQLVLIKNMGNYENSCHGVKNFPCFTRKIIGQTRDDAAGEAFDKVAKMLGLGYPGGPEIALRAKKGRSDKFILPRPMINSPDYDFSFSGLKTAVRYLLTPPLSSPDNKKRAMARCLTTNHQSLTSNICASFQQTVLDVLISKTIKAAKEYKVKSVMLAGGVAANQELRKQMENAVKKNLPSAVCYLPSAKYCTDNAAMIGLAGYWKFMRQGKGDKMEKIVAEANLNF